MPEAKISLRKILLMAGVKSEGGSNESAAVTGKVTRRTFRNWVRRGVKDIKEGKKSLYTRLIWELREADSILEMKHVKNVNTAAKRDWRAAKWMLSKKKPKIWGDESLAEFSPENLVDDSDNVYENPEQTVGTLSEKIFGHYVGPEQGK